MKLRYELLMIGIYFFITVGIIISNQDCRSLVGLYVPIYYIIGICLYFVGRSIGKMEGFKMFEDESKLRNW